MDTTFIDRTKDAPPAQPRVFAHLSKLSAAFALVAGMGIQSAVAETWNMATPYPAQNFHTVNIAQFIQDVSDLTDGAIKIDLHPGGSLIKLPEIKNAVRSGQVQLGETALSVLANENPIFQIDSLPFVVHNYEDAAKLWEASRPATEAVLEEQNIKVLYAVPWPSQGLYAVQEITDMAQLSGFKFRSVNPTTAEMAMLMGAVPTQIEMPDLAQAFATGRVEAMITSPTTGVDSKAWDYIKNFHNIQAWLPKNIVIMNLDTFNGLPPVQQTAILEAAKAAEERGWAVSEAETVAALQALKEGGMQVHEPTDGLMTQLNAVGDTILAEWRARTGAEGDEIIAQIAK